MEEKSTFKKGLVVGIILLFIGTCIIPAIAQNIEKPALPTSRGNWLYVGGDGPGNYSSIKAAVNDASDGDTIFVYSGLYNEGYIYVKKSITITGEDRDNTIIDGYSNTVGFQLEADSVKISGFTIQNYRHPWIFTAGIWIKSGYNIIQGNRIRDNSEYGIIISWGSNNIIHQNIIEHNDNCGVCLWDASLTSIESNHIVNNGYGILILNPSGGAVNMHNTIKNNNLFSNACDAYFYDVIRTCWIRNYWGSSNVFIKAIHGELLIFLPSGWQKTIPLVNFDWFPRLLPNSIIPFEE